MDAPSDLDTREGLISLMQTLEVPVPLQDALLLFKDRACKKSIRLFSIIARHVNMFEHSWIECFQDNCALDLTVRLRISFHTAG